ncbi:hypothetical protein V8J82_04610 [Gymnodinialimonas sp. 2305UL16-5]|uniref:hypothetical protein n=1 Tax=Gymnodinialimonas mytili TaxID=3126503 RepID=UPI0030B4C70C
MSGRQEPPLRAPSAPDRPVLRADARDGAARQSIWRPIVLALAGLVCLLVGLVDLSGRSANPAVPPAISAAEDIAAVTAGVYVSLRAINAALSAAQEVEVGASIGAQASVQPLKVLEPVDDTVERVADVVFAVAAGAALAVVGLEPVAALGLVVLGLGLLGYGFGRGSVARASLRAVRLGVALGLVLPLVFAGGVWLGEVATQAQWMSAMSELDAVAGEARVLIGAGEAELLETAENSDGMLSGFLSAINGARESVQSYVDAAAVFTREADTLFSATLTIIGIFVLRVIVLPVLLLWSVMVLVRRSVE